MQAVFSSSSKAPWTFIGAQTLEESVRMTASTLALETQQRADYEGAIVWYEKAGDYPGAKEAIEFIGEYYFMTAQYDLAYNARLERKRETVAARLPFLYETHYAPHPGKRSNRLPICGQS